MSKFGIDISTWQDNLNYNLLKQNNISFAIIRAGFSETKDNMFEKHYNKLKDLNIDMGCTSRSKPHKH